MWLHCCSSRGWGLVAAESIKQGQQLVAVPQRATMSALSAAGCPIVGHVAAVGGLNDWQVQHQSLFIAARLLTEDHASASARPCLGPGCAISTRVLLSTCEPAGVSQRLHWGLRHMLLNMLQLRVNHWVAAICTPADAPQFDARHV